MAGRGPRALPARGGDAWPDLKFALCDVKPESARGGMS